MNNSMVVVGGSNYQTGEYLSGLWVLTIDSSNKATWKKQDSKGYCPSPRQHAALTAHQRNILIVYGGEHEGQTLNDCYIYRTDNKVWVAIDEYSYDMRIPCRLKPALCSLNDHLYLFGGERTILEQDEVNHEPMGDFYQIRMLNRPMNTRLDVWVKKIIGKVEPSARVGQLVTLSEKVLVLWGREVGEEGMERGVWAYYVPDYTWHWVKWKVSSIPSLLLGSTINLIIDKCYIFGQYPNPSDNKKNGLQVMTIDWKDL